MQTDCENEKTCMITFESFINIYNFKNICYKEGILSLLDICRMKVYFYLENGF